MIDISHEHLQALYSKLLHRYVSVCVYDKAISDKMILCNFFLIVQTDHRRGLFVLVDGRQNIMYHRKAEIIYRRSTGLMGSDSTETE